MARKRAWVQVDNDIYSKKDPLGVKYHRKIFGRSSSILGGFLLLVFYFEDFLLEYLEDMLPIMMPPWVYITIVAIFFLMNFIQFVRIMILDINSYSEVIQFYSGLPSLRFNILCMVIYIPLATFIVLDVCRMVYRMLLNP